MKVTVKRHTLSNALSSAAVRFTEHAAECRKDPAFERLAEQFDRQAKECHELADEIELSDMIVLED